MNEDDIAREGEAMANEDLGRMSMFLYLLLILLVAVVAGAALWWILT